MVKDITIQDGKTFKFKSSARLPIIYRNEIGTEFFEDVAKMETNTVVAFNMAYAMYKHANPDSTEDMETWLEQFEMMSLVNALPEMVGMITAEFKQTSSAKKKNVQ